MWNVVDRLARKYDGYIVTFDNQLKYNGNRKNVLSFNSDNIRLVLAVMSLCKAGVGPDSFGVHGFGACGVPVYGIFGPTDPAIRLKYFNAFWSPKSDCPYQYCWYKYHSCKTGISCLNAQTSKFYVDDFFEKLGDLL
jgi:ADP-heptose:LPS heptosyltransferase